MLHQTRSLLAGLLLSLVLVGCSSAGLGRSKSLDPIDYVDPYMGNISHLLVPTFPTVHLPNGMMRVHPQRTDYASEQIAGLPVILTSHRGVSAFAISPLSALSDSLPEVSRYSYDSESVRPYLYEVTLLEPEVRVRYAPSYRSAIYQFNFERAKAGHHLVFSTPDGELVASGKRTLRVSISMLRWMQSPRSASYVIRSRAALRRSMAWHVAIPSASPSLSRA